MHGVRSLNNAYLHYANNNNNNNNDTHNIDNGF